jgi:hypothetical protein
MSGNSDCAPRAPSRRSGRQTIAGNEPLGIRARQLEASAQKAQACLA